MAQCNFNVCAHALLDVLEASEHRPKYEMSVTGKKRIKPGSRTVTIGTTALACVALCTAAGASQLTPARAGTKVEVNGRDIAIFKNYGQLYALDNTCPHQGASLHLGDIEDFDGLVCISCPRHHWPFSLDDGSCLIPVKIQATPHPVRVRTHRDGTKWLYVGFPALADALFSNDDF